VEPPPLAHCVGWLQNSCFCKRPSLLKKLIAASGLDPSTYKSGKYEGKSRISKRGNRHLRRVIWLMSTKVIINNNLFRTYFYKRRNEGLPYKMAVLATAYKLIRIMLVMLSRKTYLFPPCCNSG
jgi:transposase